VPIRHTVSLFRMQKKNVLYRPIGNPQLNKCISTIIPLELPSMLCRHSQVLQCAVAIQEDFQSFFCQIGLHPSASLHFGARYHNFTFSFLCLPQGFSQSPALAQTVSNIVTRSIPHCFPCIDNIFFGALFISALAYQYRRFMVRCQYLGVVCKQSSFLPTSTMVFVGVEYDLSAKLFRSDPAFVQKVSPFLTHLYACNLPLTVLHAYKLCRRVVTVMSDASLCGAAFVSPSMACVWPWPCRFPPGDISTLKLNVIRLGLSLLLPSSPGTLFVWYTDSKNAVQAISHGRSASQQPYIDLFLCQIHLNLLKFGCEILPVHIKTHENLTDGPSHWFDSWFSS